MSTSVIIFSRIDKLRLLLNRTRKQITKSSIKVMTDSPRRSKHEATEKSSCPNGAPLSSAMERYGTILFFGDTSTPVTSALAQLLDSERKDTLLSKFLILSKTVLCDSIEKLPQQYRKDAYRFTELHDFTDPQHGKSSSLRVLSPALLVITQLGQFISWVFAFDL